MVKLNLIVDGNYLLMRVVHILHKNQILVSELYNVIERDYLNLVKLYSFDKIYFVSDSLKNWRKDVYKEYKGTRKKDIKIDWDFVFSEYDKLKNFLKTKKNCKLLQIESLEGDDIISYLTKITNSRGDSNFIMSNDSDLLQLIEYNLNKRYINIMYNYRMTDDRVFVPEHYDIFINNIKNNYKDDIFEDSNDIDFLNFFNDFVKKRKINQINSEQELFMKIMGHNKDNIKSIYMKGDRGIGKSGIDKIYKNYKITHPEPIDFNSEIFIDRLLNHIKLYKRIKDKNLDTFMINRLKMNLTLVKLDEKSMPKNLYENMKNFIKI